MQNMDRGSNLNHFCGKSSYKNDETILCIRILSKGPILKLYTV